MQGFFERIRAATDRHAVWDALVGYFDRRGFDKIYAIHFPPPGASDGEHRIAISSGYPEELVLRYLSTDMWDNDAVPRYARSHPKPFFWFDVQKEMSLTEKQKGAIAEFAALGVRNGLAIPVFGPNGRNGCVSVAIADDGRRLTDPEIAEFQAVSQMAHQRFCELLEDRVQEPITLSPRETEILTWVARGKSNNVIGEILGISANTVDTHLRRIYEKLEVSDRTTAAIRGIGCGIIRP
ncbi:LuxR family transcriptional regulator [Parasphingopyxis marina]|uniref:LuxR family transcriptional regulator n=1 Tax=Parasphingopyxis marina TaxID=2761622 RepID=A0A842I0Y1_9SPHN|nr:LuxR family transcriptional regulator [Parasphingopyxis marina]MBC2779186.1 LuxR family transcriptional regulator [Parasphingopyxis marina]